MKEFKGLTVEELEEREEFTTPLAEDGGSCQGKCGGTTK